MSQEDLEQRVRRLEDELAVRRAILSYGPAADAGLAEEAASLWTEDGTYDWDPRRTPHEGRAAIQAMLRSDDHRRLIETGVAHFAGPPLIDIDGDRATALTYSLILRRDAEERRYYLWRVSAATWEFERTGETWRIRCRTHRLLDETGAGRDLFQSSVQAMFTGADT
jgi:SnoaL-like domain